MQKREDLPRRNGGEKGETDGKKENVAAFFCAASTRRKKMPQHLPEGKSES
jgi:hypothetical protein